MNLKDLPARRLARPAAQLRAGRRDWYRITNSADGASAEIAIYDEIGYFGVTSNDFVQQLAALDVQHIDLRLNSPGGDVFDGVAIYNALRAHPASVTSYVDGLAASTASVILQAGDTRVAAKASQVMIHNPSTVAIGTAADMRAAADMLDQVTEMIAGVYADRSGGKVDAFRAAMDAESWYAAAEAKSAGLVDEVASSGASKSDDSWDLSVFAYSGRAQAPAPVIPDRDAFDVSALTDALKGAFA